MAVDDIDLSDIDGLWAQPIAHRHDAFARLRAEEPVRFFAEPVLPWAEQGPGYFAVTRLDDVVAASRDTAAFRSHPHASGIPDIPPAVAEFFASSMMNQDNPRHDRLRRIVSRGFTARRLALIRGQVADTARTIVDDIVEAGECDVPSQISARLPLKVVCDLMGVPDSQYEFVFRRTNVLLGPADPEYVAPGTHPLDALRGAAGDLAALVREIGALRQREPRDDVISALVNAEVDGERLTGDELGAFFILLAAAGNETARNAISWGVKLLSDHPDQRAAWLADVGGVTPTAVEEILRWSSPVMFARRTLAQPAVLSGVELPAGSKALLYFWSANRDEAYFPDGHRFDVRRSPNPHVAFGGPGPHFCLGAHLARTELAILFTELLTRVPDLQVAAEPVRLRSLFMNGIKRMPATFTPSRAVTSP
jgi:cytochrome P450